MTMYYATVSNTLYIKANTELEAKAKAMVAYNEYLAHQPEVFRLPNPSGIKIGVVVGPSQLR